MDYPGPSASASSRARPGSCSPCTRRSPASWATSSGTRSTGWRSGCSTTRRGSRRRPAPSSSSSTRASCSAASARTAIDAVVEQLAELRERLEGKGRAVPFGVEVMGRVRELGTPEDVVAIAGALRLGAARCSTSRTCTRRATAPSRTSSRSRRVLEAADAVLEPRRAVPHPLLRHRLREPQRDEAPALRRGDAARRAARRGARALRPARDGDQRVARRGVDPGDPGRAQLGTRPRSWRRQAAARARSSTPRPRRRGRGRAGTRRAPRAPRAGR